MMPVEEMDEVDAEELLQDAATLSDDEFEAAVNIVLDWSENNGGWSGFWRVVHNASVYHAVFELLGEHFDGGGL